MQSMTRHSCSEVSVPLTHDAVQMMGTWATSCTTRLPSSSQVHSRASSVPKGPGLRQEQLRDCASRAGFLAKGCEQRRLAKCCRRRLGELEARMTPLRSLRSGSGEDLRLEEARGQVAARIVSSSCQAPSVHRRCGSRTRVQRSLQTSLASPSGPQPTPGPPCCQGKRLAATDTSASSLGPTWRRFPAQGLNGSP